MQNSDKVGPAKVSMVEFAAATRRRLRLWRFGLLAALLPEAIPIIRSIFCSGDLASEAILHAFAAMALISAVGFIDVSSRLWKVDHGVSRLGNVIFTLLSVTVAVVTVVVSNYYSHGLGSEWTTLIAILFAACLALWVLGEAWLANKFGQWKNIMET